MSPWDVDDTDLEISPVPPAGDSVSPVVAAESSADASTGTDSASVPVEAPSWNPRYVAYATAHGHSPQDMLAVDRARFPGGHMTGYVVWIDGQWREWRELHGRSWLAALTAADHASFDAWLSARFPHVVTPLASDGAVPAAAPPAAAGAPI